MVPNDMVQDAFTQLVQSPTRGSNIIDLVLTNEPLVVCDVKVEEPFVTGNHSHMAFNLYTQDELGQHSAK